MVQNFEEFIDRTSIYLTQVGLKMIRAEKELKFQIYKDFILDNLINFKEIIYNYKKN